MVRHNHKIAYVLIELILLNYVKINIHAFTLGCMHILCKCFSFDLKLFYDTLYIKDLLQKLLKSVGDLGIQML